MSDTYSLEDLYAIKEAQWLNAPMPSWDGIDTSGFQPVGYIQDIDYGLPVNAPPDPLRCPHCRRDWHTEPLTRRVADTPNHVFMWMVGHSEPAVPKCLGKLPDVNVEFGPEQWPVEHVLALFPAAPGSHCAGSPRRVARTNAAPSIIRG